MSSGPTGPNARGRPANAEPVDAGLDARALTLVAAAHLARRRLQAVGRRHFVLERRGEVVAAPYGGASADLSQRTLGLAALARFRRDGLLHAERRLWTSILRVSTHWLGATVRVKLIKFSSNNYPERARRCAAPDGQATVKAIRRPVPACQESADYAPLSNCFSYILDGTCAFRN